MNHLLFAFIRNMSVPSRYLIIDLILQSEDGCFKALIFRIIHNGAVAVRLTDNVFHGFRFGSDLVFDVAAVAFVDHSACRNKHISHCISFI